MRCGFRKNFLMAMMLLLGLVLAGCDKESAPKKDPVRPVKTVVVEQTGQGVNRNFPGRVVAHKEAKLSFQVSGQVIKIPVLEGSKIQKGEFIAALDPVKYQDTVNEFHAKYVLALAQYRRAAKLIKGDFISRARYDRIKSELKVAQANLNTAKQDLAWTKLHAPFTGLLAKKYVENFEHVKAKQPIVLLQIDNIIDIRIDVPESILLNIRRGQVRTDPKASFPGAPNQYFKLTFKEFSSEADPETKTYRVVYMMKSPTSVNVFPGMTANVQVHLPDFKSGGKKYFIIPSSALFVNTENKTFVWVINKKTMQAHKHPVTASRLSGSHVHILSGLKGGERIVTAGVHNLLEGQKVKILKPITGATE